MNEVITSKVDNKGRLCLPLELRESLCINSGDIFFIKMEKNNILKLAKAENPFELLAQQAIEESRKGNTITLEDYEKNRRVAKRKK